MATTPAMGGGGWTNPCMRRAAVVVATIYVSAAAAAAAFATVVTCASAGCIFSLFLLKPLFCDSFALCSLVSYFFGLFGFAAAGVAMVLGAASSTTGVLSTLPSVSMGFSRERAGEGGRWRQMRVLWLVGGPGGEMARTPRGVHTRQRRRKPG